jgi:hypothetical protein
MHTKISSVLKQLNDVAMIEKDCFSKLIVKVGRLVLSNKHSRYKLFFNKFFFGFVLLKVV